ncbi:MAG: lamin tail domain-containing protein [Pseudomonadota bacterium]|nr:lamin tail domain-containing protein [Pseudomonadota bacterium]
MTLLLLACAQTDSGFDTGTADTASPAATVIPGEVLVNEVMFDPSLVDGDFGEWLEILNVSDAEVDLAGVILHDDDNAGFVIAGSLPVPAGGVVVLGPSADSTANGGVQIDYAYSIDAVKLGNQGDTLTLSAGGVALDTFTWDATVFTVAEGSALQLSPGVDAPDGNDSPDAWCLATAAYGSGDLGSPGGANGACE